MYDGTKFSMFHNAEANARNVCFPPIADIGPPFQNAMMVLLAFLLASGASAVPADAIRLEAARCGLKPDQLVWKKDAEGHLRADVTPNGDPDGFFKSMMCLIEWGQKSGARIGFISEPPPGAKFKP